MKGVDVYGSELKTGGFSGYLAELLVLCYGSFVEVLQAAAELGFAGLYVQEDVGGSALGRRDASIVFEQLSYGDVSVTSSLSPPSRITETICRRRAGARAARPRRRRGRLGSCDA